MPESDMIPSTLVTVPTGRIAESYDRAASHRMNEILAANNSGNGCTTCRNLRIKCDEARPYCRRCKERGVTCEGFTPRLQWVDSASSVGRTSVASRKRKQKQDTLAPISDAKSNGWIEKRDSLSNAMEQCQIRPIPRYLNPNGPNFTTSLDRTLYDHSLSILPNLVFLNRSRSPEINAAHVYELHNSDPELRSALLVSSATHLFIQGVVTEIDFLRIRQRALKAVRSAIIAVSTPDTANRDTHGDGYMMPRQQEQVLSLNFSDAVLAASLKLSAAGLIRGEPLHTILPLLQGTVFLVMERHRLAETTTDSGPIIISHATKSLGSPSFTLTKRMLAYFDIMSCVPRARAPYFAERYWLTDKACEEQENIDGSGLDPTMGCFPILFALLGRCSAFVNVRFSNTVLTEHLQSVEKTLLYNLETWTPLPRRKNTKSVTKLNATQSLDYNTCLSAGNAHRLATQVFLIRSRDFDRSSAQVKKLVQSLAAEIQKVPIQSAPMTTMLWPLWVLGCESYDPSTRDQIVMPIFDQLLKRQSFHNIRLTFEALRDRIWRLAYGGEVFSISLEFKTPSSQYRWQQSEWVKYCWAEKVELTLA
ncbi:hypothetical protein K505DRAFT_383735 [Melanomma pulvis-pyrius CBS 109.77]|uniref:Zn(2)-C6 fungal-type domain-containing protein n=1 Tax=Melanomma pulvis-pyrius CBS 109.77 TaxID=1314802 RepID=A0A6A6XDN9_9PLEO|nr:hypothetical protein K505DRAFT_383735 [Melanomma pulvis-pyrius CBS 109.77]